jgi:hypothetical protein
MRGQRLSLFLAALATSVAAIAGMPLARSQDPPGPGYAWNDPSWRFTMHDRRVKVVLLAGSIGAFRDEPYGRLIHEWCANAEVRNLSQVGEGAPQLYSRFRNQVIDNPAVPVGGRGFDMWLVFGGGLNSVGVPERTNRSIRNLFLLAHRRRFGVVALTLTPWGSEEDSRRWRGARGLNMLRNTRAVVDFVLGRLTPEQGLGRYRFERREVSDPDTPWIASERPDVAIDLYDSPLRDDRAVRWPLDVVRSSLEDDPIWLRSVGELEGDALEARLEADTAALADAPRWFLKPEYRGFDHIHPNRAGHRVIAEHMCPRLPSTWGCECPSR